MNENASVIESISTCWNSSFLGITDMSINKTKFFSFGQQSKMELGRLETEGKYAVLETERDCVSSELHSCLYTTIAVFKYGDGSVEVYGWGFNNKEQLFPHQCKSDKLVQFPHLLQRFKTNNTLSCHLGKDFLVILNYKDDEVLFLGNKNLKKSLEAKKYDINKISHFTTMWSSIHFVYENSYLISLGNGQLGQLSQNGEKISPVKFLQCGSEHIIYASQKAPYKVTSWGWGEHGNCGHAGKEKEIDKSRDQQVFTEPNDVLSLHDERFSQYGSIQNVYGGCATTFVVATRK